MTSQEMAAALQGAHDGAGGGILSLGSGANQDPFPAWVGVKFPPSASWKAVPKVDRSFFMGTYFVNFCSYSAKKWAGSARQHMCASRVYLPQNGEGRRFFARIVPGNGSAQQGYVCVCRESICRKMG